jgi:hypothetical protein
MPSRTTLFVCILAAAAVLPFLLSEDGKSSLVQAVSEGPGAFFASWVKEAPAESGEAGEAKAEGEEAKTVEVAKKTMLPPNSPTADLPPVDMKYYGGPVGMTLIEALYFDASPEWISQRWPRVTTRLPFLEYHGIRVPLVTGYELEDVAGTLTYYFDSNSQVQRITFSGFTGDYEPTAALLQNRFGLRQYASVGTALFLAYWEGRPIGMLRIEEASLAEVDKPDTRYRVEIELNLPRTGASLSPATLLRLQKLREARLL